MCRKGWGQGWLGMEVRPCLLFGPAFLLLVLYRTRQYLNHCQVSLSG